MRENTVSRSSVTSVLARILADINRVTIMIHRMHYRHLVESNDPALAILLLTLDKTHLDTYIHTCRQPTNKKRVSTQQMKLQTNFTRNQHQSNSRTLARSCSCLSKCPQHDAGNSNNLKTNGSQLSSKNIQMAVHSERTLISTHHSST